MFLIQAFFEIGVLPGYDMTTEAALAKLSYVLGRDDLSLDDKKQVTSLYTAIYINLNIFMYLFL